jgi:tetratricopeptide (TPR) repeat protein
MTITRTHKLQLQSRAEKGPTLKEIVQAYSYHSLLDDEDSESSDSYDSSDFDDDELSCDDSDGSGGEDDNDDDDDDDDEEGSEDETPEQKGPTKPLTRVRFEHDLTLPPLRRSSPYDSPGGCENASLRDGFWLRDPKLRLMKSDMGFLSQLTQLCIQSKVRECTNLACLEKKGILERIAPKCDWPSFRNWALVSMSCQAAMTREQKLSQAHTHLAKAASGCSLILKDCVMAKHKTARFHSYLDGNIDNRVGLGGVSNIIYWMARIQAEMGIGPKKFGTWGPRFLPSRVTVPAIADAISKAQTWSICKNRLWNLVNVSNRKQSDLPDIVEIIDANPSFLHQNDDQDGDGEGWDHEYCTPSKCQWAHMNSESVGQLHKCGKEGTNEREKCQQMIFPVELLETCLELGKPTSWQCTGTRLSTPKDKYIAISHVWSDGTGVGAKNPGSVNKCLFEFFSDIAEKLDCKAVWWDALSIPQEADARSKSLKKMHWNYAHAECTVVHDNYLVNFEWKDDGSPCLALVLSSWFTRGWTALELFMSKEVKVLFKDPSGAKEPLIKDLDQDVLAPGPAAVSRAHWLATSLIQRLRQPIDSVGDLLVILTPRSTSWVRDRTVIAALLSGVPNCDFKQGESLIAREILKYLGKIPHACLLHGKPTMFDSGRFSWCPAVIDDMPVDQSLDMKGSAGAKKAAQLEIDGNGSVQGWWWSRQLERDEIKNKKIKPFGDNVAAMVKINSALGRWKHCLLLRQSLDPDDPALLVVPFGVVPEDSLLDCRYIGAVTEDCEESTLIERKFNFAWEKYRVRIGGNEEGTEDMRATRALQLMDKLEDEYLNGGGNEKLPELPDYVQSSDEEADDFPPTSDDKAWYKSETALEYYRQDIMDDGLPRSSSTRPDAGHLFIAIEKEKKKAMQHLVKNKIDLDLAQKKSLVTVLGKDNEYTYDRIKSLGDVYSDNNMLLEAIEMYETAITGYKSFEKLEGPLDYLKAQYALSKVYMKAGQQKEATMRPRGAGDFRKAKELLIAVWKECDAKTVRRHSKKAHKPAQSQQPAVSPADQSTNDGKNKKILPSVNNKPDKQGSHGKSKDRNSEDQADEWYRLELDSIADLTLLHADNDEFDQAANSYSKVLKKFGMPPDHIEVFMGEWKFRLTQPHEEKQKRDIDAASIYESALRRFDILYRKTHMLNMITAVNLGINYSNNGKFLEAEELLRRGLEGFRELDKSSDARTTRTGTKHMMTLLTTHRLGFLLKLRHIFDEAETLLKDARDGFLLKLGPDHSLTLTMSCDLAQFYLTKQQPQYDESQKLFEDAKLRLTKKLGPNHRSTLLASLGLGKVRARKDTATKLNISIDVLRRLQPRPGVHDLSICDTLLYLSRLYEDQGHLKKADETLRQCRKGFEFLDGPMSVKYLQATRRLGCLCDKQKKPDEAEELLNEALKGFEKVQGAFHNSTLKTAHDLGSLFSTQNKLKEAETHCSRAYKGFEKIEDSRSTAEAAQALGTVYLEQGKYEDAERMYTLAFNSLQNLLKDKNENAILQSAVHRGKVLLAIGGAERNAAAEKMYKHAVAGYKKTKGDNDPLTLNAQLKLGEVYRKQRDYKAAEKEILEALEGLEGKLPAGDAQIFEAMLCLGHLKFDQRRADEDEDDDDDQGNNDHEAKDRIKRARDGLSDSLGRDAPLSLDACALLGELYLYDGDDDDGEKELKAALDGYCKRLSPGHPKTIQTFDRLIEHYEKTGMSEEAEELLDRKREALKAGYGMDYAVRIMGMTDRKRTTRERFDWWSDYDSDSSDDTSDDDSTEEKNEAKCDSGQRNPQEDGQRYSGVRLTQNLPVVVKEYSGQSKRQEQKSAAGPYLAGEKGLPTRPLRPRSPMSYAHAAQQDRPPLFAQDSGIHLAQHAPDKRQEQKSTPSSYTYTTQQDRGYRPPLFTQDSGIDLPLYIPDEEHGLRLSREADRRARPSYHNNPRQNAQHLNTWRNMETVASKYRNRGWRQEANELKELMLQARYTELGFEDPYIFAGMIYLATKYRDRGWWSEAQLVLVPALEASQKVLGPGHPHALACMANLAYLLEVQGRLDEAEKVKAQEGERKVNTLGPEHPEALDSLADLAWMYARHGRLKDAEKLGETALAGRERALGVQHPDVVATMKGLIGIYAQLPDRRKAGNMKVRLDQIELQMHTKRLRGRY